MVLDISRQKLNPDPNLIYHIKMKSKWIMDLNVKHAAFPGSSVDKEYACNSGDPSSIPGSGRYSGEGHGYPLQYSCLENPVDREAWWATIHGVTRVGHN